MQKKLHTFCWFGMNSSGETISGETQDINSRYAENKLIRKNIRIISIKKKKTTIFTKNLKTKNIEIFFSQLAILIKAKLTLNQSIDIIKSQQTNCILKKICITLSNEIKAGNGLANGLKYFPEYFSDSIYHLIQTGEQTANLENVLNYITQHMQTRRKLKQKLIQATTYPIIIIIFAITITIFLLIIVVPKFVTIFAKMHTPIPLLTKIIILISKATSCLVLPIIFGIACILGLLYYFKNSFFNKFLTSYWQKLPIIKKLVQKNILINFFYSLSIFLQANIPLPQALKLTKPIFTTGYAKVIENIYNQVITGRNLHEAMIDQTIFTPTTIHMIKAGEESGSINKIITEIIELKTNELNHLIEIISQIIEPLIMLFLGALIGTLVIAMYLPILKMGNTF